MPYRFAIELSRLFNISLMCQGVFTYSGNMWRHFNQSLIFNLVNILIMVSIISGLGRFQTLYKVRSYYLYRKLGTVENIVHDQS